jgi:hypothetical protein
LDHSSSEGNVILIIEPHPEVAAALEEVISTARFTSMVIPHLERLSDLVVTPAAIVVRIAFEGTVPAHAAIEHLPPNHPPVVAIAWDDAEMAEAERLKCDVVLRAPRDVTFLCDTLRRVAQL